MEKNLKSRFNISERSQIENKYILYVEDLYVSFKGTKESNKIKERIKNIKLQIKNFDEKIYKEKVLELKTELNVLKSKLKTLPKGPRIAKKVLKGVTFGLRKGETLAIIGANGAGKTVLMETILGLVKHQKGEVYLDLGEETFTKNLKHVGIQFQQSKFPKSIKTMELISFYTEFYGDKVDRMELLKMIEVFGIEEYLSSKVDQLSGGQKQRLNLLLSIMHQPKIMILDEFITGLDVRTVRRIITYVNELKIKNEASMIIISHQPEEIEELSDRIIILNDGRVTAETYVPDVIGKYGSVAVFVEEMI